MYEVEAKVPVKKSDCARLGKEILRIAEPKGKSVKDDYYFLDSEGATLRLRMEKGRGVLTVKKKQRSGGVERNREMEWEVPNPRRILKVMEKAGLPFIRKKKHSEAFAFGVFRIELNLVEGLGYFLEIETVVKSKSAIPGAEKKLHELFRRFGFSRRKYEKKYYLELLKEKGGH